MMVFDTGFFIELTENETTERDGSIIYCPNGLWLLQLIFSPGETLKYLQKYR